MEFDVMALTMKRKVTTECPLQIRKKISLLLATEFFLGVFA
jgi:hypothetical protein